MKMKSANKNNGATFSQINLLYLLNILRVLVTKLRNSQCSEAEQLR